VLERVNDSVRMGRGRGDVDIDVSAFGIVVERIRAMTQPNSSGAASGNTYLREGTL
jgi:hypothetical protein